MKKLGILLALCMVILLLPGRAAAVDLEIGGKSALLMDMATGQILYEKNAHALGTGQCDQGHDHAADHGGH